MSRIFWSVIFGLAPSSIMLFYCLIFIVLILLVVERWKSGKFSKLQKYIKAAKKYLPIIGNAIQFMGSNEDIMKVLQKFHIWASKRKHNVEKGWIGKNLFVVIADADKACTVLKTALDKNYIHKMGKALLGDGSVFAPVATWHRRRKILVPTFAPRYVNSFVPIFEAQSKVTADLLEANVGKGNMLCFDYFCRYSLDSVCETLFGVNVDVQRNPADKFFHAFMQSQQIIAKRLFQPLLYIDAVYKMLPIYFREKRMVKIVHEFVDDLIQKKKIQLNEDEESVENSDTETDKIRPGIKTFVEIMIENFSKADKAYTKKELQEESIVLALAGTETSAIGVCFTIFLLSQNPDIQDKVYKEIHDAFGKSDEPLSFENLQNLKYLKAVIKEALRLYPPAPIIMRHCDKDIVLAPNLTLPKGCNALISIWGIHRKPEYWGEDVDEFNPDRFLSGKINPNAFLTFSHGPRNCIGQHYGILSMMTILVTILRRYHFKAAANFKYDKNNPLRLSYYIMMKHVGNFPVQIEYRDQTKRNVINDSISEKV